jgi:hypothetical protein
VTRAQIGEKKGLLSKTITFLLMSITIFVLAGCRDSSTTADSITPVDSVLLVDKSAPADSGKSVLAGKWDELRAGDSTQLELFKDGTGVLRHRQSNEEIIRFAWEVQGSLVRFSGSFSEPVKFSTTRLGLMLESPRRWPSRILGNSPGSEGSTQFSFVLEYEIEGARLNLTENRSTSAVSFRKQWVD